MLGEELYRPHTAFVCTDSHRDELSAEILTVLSMADILYLLLVSWSI